MLRELNQNTEMNSPPQQATSQLAVHQTNIFQPHRLGVKLMAASPSRVYLAARRAYLESKDINCPFSLLDFYDITSKTQPKHVHSIIEYEDITGIAWIDEQLLISVSQQATINIYDIKSGIKIRSKTTDYGSITSLRYSNQEGMLLTGTELGFAVVYQVVPETKTIEFASKMVQTTHSIISIDFHMTSKDRTIKTPQAPHPKTQKPSELLGHSKRKKADSSDDESEDEDDGDADCAFLSSKNITIYGAHSSSVVAWDYHRGVIIDTIVVGNEVTTILVVRNGNIVIGDCSGYLGIFDHISFTCRQSDQVSRDEISTLSTDSKGSCILASGLEPIITILKVDKSIEAKDEFILFERLKDHGTRINCSLFTSKKEFFTGGDDNKIVKFRLTSVDSKTKMKRYTLYPSYKNKLHFGNQEAMVIFGKSLQVFNFKDLDPPTKEIQSNSQRILPEPSRFCTVRASAYVHSATIDDKWICFATSKALKILDRPNLSRVDTPSESLPACHILKLCQSGNYLIAGQQRKLSIIKLIHGDRADTMHVDDLDEGVELSGGQSKGRVQEVIYSNKTKGVIRDMVYLESCKQLIVSCGTSSQYLYILQLPDDPSSDEDVRVISKIGLPSAISHLAINMYNQSDTNLYIYTAKDQLIKCDIASENFKDDLVRRIAQQDRIHGLSKGSLIQGVLVLSESKCLIYDTIYMFKLDIDAQKIINATSDYANILTVDNRIFNKADEILIVSTT